MEETAGDEVRRAREAAGMTQRELAKEVSRQGVRMSTPTLSRCEMGRRAFKTEELAVIRRVLAPASGMEPANDPAPGIDLETAAALTSAGETGRRRRTGPRVPWAAAFGVGASVIALALVLQVRTVLTSGDAAASPSASQADAGCGRYEVAARDLWLRDRYGEPLVQLPHGLALTDAGGGDDAGRYRHVSTTDGRSGWVDPAYLKPRCP
ncbi:helix-turn-helix transcriptional regulator [Microbispora sp. CA-135349]|uniref:helix-turn-helix transcriptional regulator n=1 Tax=Microbispora sp. CA-135349 TaxID=3239953 RepID=UPI003D8CCDB1